MARNVLWTVSKNPIDHLKDLGGGWLLSGVWGSLSLGSPLTILDQLDHQF